MKIKQIKIRNFKRFNCLEMNFLPGINILVGDNEAGKSTILEAINLSLSGIHNGRYLKNEISQSIFNKDVVRQYLESLATADKMLPPEISIEVHMAGDGLGQFDGDCNAEGHDSCGFTLRIKIDERNHDLYEAWIDCEEYSSLPVEFYNVYLEPFSRDREITFRHIPLKSALIDGSGNKNLSGNDLYVSRIIKDMLDQHEIVGVSQAFRRSRDVFAKDGAIVAINSKIEEAAKISRKKISITIDQAAKNAWENGLFTYLDDIPFHSIGKGEQSIIKTKIAIAHKKMKEKNILLIEEPENHLSHARLNELLNDISEIRDNRQILISTHSSFVANKLGLDSLILIGDSGHLNLSSLDPTTKDFFSKIPGYDTLRLILCRKAILVEGDSDELIVQRAYMDKNSGKLPIEDGIEVISVRTAFLRFLEIAKAIGKPVKIVTDSDGQPDAVKEKYAQYTSDKICLCLDSGVDSGKLVISGKDFNYNTLEPKLLKVNSMDTFNRIFGKSFDTVDEMHVFMKRNKTECALKIFEQAKPVRYPQYILEAIAP